MSKNKKHHYVPQFYLRQFRIGNRDSIGVATLDPFYLVRARLRSKDIGTWIIFTVRMESSMVYYNRLNRRVPQYCGRLELYEIASESARPPWKSARSRLERRGSSSSRTVSSRSKWSGRLVTSRHSVGAWPLLRGKKAKQWATVAMAVEVTVLFFPMPSLSPISHVLRRQFSLALPHSSSGDPTI
jgi:hypothetical protein